MSVLVLDASVAAKWFLPGKDEPLSQEAFRLLERYVEGEVRFAVPDLFWAELANVLWKAVRQGRCSKATAQSALAEMARRKLPTVPSHSLLDEAFSIAVAFHRTVYDSLYLALAVQLEAHAVTADERLAKAVGGQLPVRWLGSI